MSNFLRDYEATLMKYTDAPHIFHRASATALLGAALSTKKNRCNVDGGAGHRWTNLWVILVGDAGRSRKSTCVHMNHEVLRRSEECKDLRAPDDGSPEGFARDLAKREQAMEGNAANLMMQGELMAFLSALAKDYMRGSKGMFMDWYEVPPEWKRMLSKEEYKLVRPRVSLLGGINVALMPTVITSEDWLGGMMSRCLLIPGSVNRELREPTTPEDCVYQKLATQLDELLGEWQKTREKWEAKKANKGPNPMLLSYDPKAAKLRLKIEDKYRADQSPQVKELMQRADGHFHKLAAIEHVAMNPGSLVISVKDVEAAAVLWEHWHKSAPVLMERTFARSNKDLEGDQLPRRMLRVLADAGSEGIEEHKLMERTVLDSDRFQKAFVSLEMARLAKREVDEDGITRARLM